MKTASAIRDTKEAGTPQKATRLKTARTLPSVLGRPRFTFYTDTRETFGRFSLCLEKQEEPAATGSQFDRTALPATLVETTRAGFACTLRILPRNRLDGGRFLHRLNDAVGLVRSIQSKTVAENNRCDKDEPFAQVKASGPCGSTPR